MRARPHSPLFHALSVALKTLLAFLVAIALVAWDLPFLSQRLRGDKDYKGGRYAEAIEHYQRALERDGHDWELLYNLGTSYYRDGRWESAVEEFSYAAQIAEDEDVGEIDRAHVYHNLGLAYLQLDDCANAVPALAQAAELGPGDEDIARNLAFAEEYCADELQDAPRTEGEEEEEGEGDEEDEDQGQSDEGQSSDETEAQDESECDQGDQPGEAGQKDSEDEQEGSEGEEPDETDQRGDEGEDETAQGGQGEQEEEQEGEGEEDSEQPSDEAGDQDKQNQGEGEEEQQSGSADSEAGSPAEGGPREIPDDGLGLSEAQIREILDRMSRLERSNAPRYFQNQPGEGEWLDDESFIDLFRRLFWGISSDDSSEQPDDGIDW